jgi:aconitate hydratase
VADNLTNKILRSHLAYGTLAAGNDITVRVDQVLIEDATGTMSAMQFEMLDADHVEVPLAVMYVDHNVLQIDDKNMQDHRYLQTFSARYGLRYSPPGHGISHYIHLEHFARPGDLLVGADSHSSMAGAVGMFATGAGGLETAVAMAGYGFDFPCPKVIGVELVGHLAEFVSPKDVVLEILRRYGVRGGRGAVFEFFGEGVDTISVTGRATICNMIVETGATTAIFPSDNGTRSWLTSQGRGDEFVALSADSGATYDRIERIDLSTVVPLVAAPQSPGNVFPAAELSDVEVVQVCVGSSVNSSYEDLATVSAMLSGRTVRPSVQMTVTPGSRQILNTIVADGVYQDLMLAGARLLEPVCGPCVGIGQAPLRDAPSLRTFNRNFPGRSGTAGDKVYLCSPATAAASAITGRITDPREGKPPTLNAASAPDLHVHETMITKRLPDDVRRSVVIERGPNLVSPPQPGPLPRNLDGKVLIVVGDDISTGDMAPDGAVAMSVWSNIAECAKFMFTRLDADFHDRARAWGGGFIVAGDNYGQGSSREHAALIPLYLGVPAIAARSYARIHRRNLIAVGIVPLVLPASAPAFDVGQNWHVEDIAQVIASGDDSVDVQINGAQSFAAAIDLSPGEREVILAGGLLAQVRTGRREQLQRLGDLRTVDATASA